MVDRLCCEDSKRTIEQGTSPFSQIVALRFYDGPTAGVAKCSYCAVAFAYALLWWDAKQEQRRFAFRQVSDSVFDEVIRAYSYDKPKVPFWYPANPPSPDIGAAERAGVVRSAMVGNTWVATVKTSRYMDHILDLKRLDRNESARVHSELLDNSPFQWEW